jgi:hypothetical protein
MTLSEQREKTMGYRRLASGVIQQAVRDFKRGPEDKRYESARRFLRSDMYPWLDLLRIDPDIIREVVKKL